MTIITSKANSVVKNAKKLHQKKYRKSAYLIEGWHLFEEAVQAGVTIEKIFAIEKLPRSVSCFSANCLGIRGYFARFGGFSDSTGNCCGGSKEEVEQTDFSQGQVLVFWKMCKILVMWERSFGLRMQQVLLE